MSIEIKTIGGRVLYTAETAADVRAALVEAVKRGAYLGGADLRGAYLGGADLGGADLGGAYLRGAYLGGAYLGGAYLRGADLRGAYLGGADLRGADLRGAYLRGADLRGADLRGADLRGADLRGVAIDDPSHPFHLIRADLWSILDAAPLEVPALREALVTGAVDGSTYSGDCACLVGTIANARGVNIAGCLVLEGGIAPIVMSASRPAEQWFAPIRPEQCATAEASEDEEEGVFRARLALEWVDQWTVSRTGIAEALAGKAA